MSSEHAMVAVGRSEVQQLRDANRQLQEEKRQLQQQMNVSPSPPGSNEQRSDNRQPADSSKLGLTEPGRTSPAHKAQTTGKKLFCYYCKQGGHVKRDCLERRASEWIDADKLFDDDSYDIRANGIQQEDELKSRSYLRMRINNHWVSCLLDSGCDLTILPARLVRQNQIEKTHRKVRAANDTDIPILGTTQVMGKVGNVKMPIWGLVSEQVAEPMLSIKWLKENKAVWNFDEGTIQLRGRTHQLETRDRPDTWVRRVILADDIDLPARSELDVPVKVMCHDGGTLQEKKSTPWATERKALRPGVHIAGTVVPEGSTTVLVRVANLQDGAVHIGRGTVLADLEPVEVLNDRAAEPKMTPTHIADMLDRVDPSVPPSVKQDLEALLNKYSNAFSTGELDLDGQIK